MVRVLLLSAVVAGILAVALCSLAAADDVWYPWWDRAPNVTYFWDDWSHLTGGNVYAPDVVTGIGGPGTDAITVNSPGAGLMEGPLPGFGSKTNFWELGPGGAMNVNVDSNPRGMDVWLQVTYYEGMVVAPTISLLGTGIHQIQISPGQWDARVVAEDTGNVGPNEPTGWITYASLWRIDPGASFTGIDITADASWGSIIDQVAVGTKILPEPGAVMLALLGSSTLVALRRYRRK